MPVPNAPFGDTDEKSVFFRCKSDFYHTKTTFFEACWKKGNKKKDAFVKCGTFCCNVKFVDFCSIYILNFAKKGQKDRIGIFVALILGGASPSFPHRATSTMYLNCTGHLSLVFPHFRDVECFGTGNFRARHRPEILQNSLAFMCVVV